MKVVVQRVLSASVSVEGVLINEIKDGILLLVGFKCSDTKDDVGKMARKIIKLKVFEEKDKMWKLSVKDLDLSILSVSQFTLYGRLKGNKPDFHLSMPSEDARSLYEYWIDELKSNYKPDRVFDGKFGAHMQVKILNDGPVTIVLDTDKESFE